MKHLRLFEEFETMGDGLFRIKHDHGFLDYEYDEESGTYFLIMVQVDPSYRNKGIATQLLDEFFKMVNDDKGLLDWSELLPDGKKYLTLPLIRFQEKYTDIEYM